MSLAGRTILITRPVRQARELTTRLHAERATAIGFPIIDIQPAPEALTALPAKALRADWLIFVSPSAIELAWPVLRTLPTLPRLACVGAASAQKLAALSQRPVLYPKEGSDSVALLEQSELCDVQGQSILIIRGADGRMILSQHLNARGAQVDHADIYHRVDAAPNWAQFDQLCTTGQLDGCIVTSSEIANRLFQLAGSDRVRTLQCLQYCVPHPRIAEQLAAQGVTRIVTTQASDAAMVAGLKEWFSRHP